MRRRIQIGLFAGFLGVAPLMFAEEFSSTPKTQTLAQAIAYEKDKLARSEAQAQKEASGSGKTQRAKSKAPKKDEPAAAAAKPATKK